jgi:nucleoid DNA-binding protein
MIKSDLVDKVMEATELPKPKATEAVNALFE